MGQEVWLLRVEKYIYIKKPSVVADQPKEEASIKLLLCHINRISLVVFHPPAVIYLDIFITSLFFDKIFSNLTSFLPNSCGNLSSLLSLSQFSFFPFVLWQRIAFFSSLSIVTLCTVLGLFSSFALYRVLHCSRSYFLFLCSDHWFLSIVSSSTPLASVSLKIML